MREHILDTYRPFAAAFVALAFSLTAQAKNPAYSTSAACQTFQAQINSADSRNEQFVVYKNGAVAYNWADGVVKKETPRQMWSVSKTITSTLMGAAVQDGKVNLDDSIAQYFPEFANDKRVDQANFHKVKIRDLLQMTSGFEWKESARLPIEEQSDLPFFYSKGYLNLVKFIARTRFEAEPGKKWNYSSVNAILQMAILRKAYGDQANEMPWTKLFGPLGLKSARFEKDRSGNYVGAAYIHLSAQDLGKIGLLYLNDGVWNGVRILPEGWVQNIATKMTPLSAFTAKVRSDFIDKGPYSRGGFWLNKTVKGLGRPFPDLPETAYFASGLFGQMLMILPEQNMVVTRTGYSDPDNEPQYNEIVANAMKCFGPNEKGTPKRPAVALPQASQVTNPFAVFNQIPGFASMLSDGSFTGMLAKELCSCHFVAKLPVEECIARSPVPSMVASLVADIRTDEPSRSITLYPRISTYPAQAQFNVRAPREGCRLIYGQADIAAAAAAAAKKK